MQCVVRLQTHPLSLLHSPPSHLSFPHSSPFPCSLSSSISSLLHCILSSAEQVKASITTHPFLSPSLHLTSLHPLRSTSHDFFVVQGEGMTTRRKEEGRHADTATHVFVEMQFGIFLLFQRHLNASEDEFFDAFPHKFDKYKSRHAARCDGLPFSSPLQDPMRWF